MSYKDSLGAQAIKAIKSAIVNDKEIQYYIGQEDIAKAVIDAPGMSLTLLSENNFKAYITVSINRIEAYETHDEHYIKIGVVTDVTGNLNPSALVLNICSRLVDILTKPGVNFIYPQNLIFGEQEETFFDTNQHSWGYVMIFSAEDEPS